MCPLEGEQAGRVPWRGGGTQGVSLGGGASRACPLEGEQAGRVPIRSLSCLMAFKHRTYNIIIVSSFIIKKLVLAVYLLKHRLAVEDSS